jgi:hypothetical protein
MELTESLNIRKYWKKPYNPTSSFRLWAVATGIRAPIGNHSFRTTGITA